MILGSVAQALREHARAEWDRFDRGECSWPTVIAAVRDADAAVELLDARESAAYHRWLFERPMGALRAA